MPVAIKNHNNTFTFTGKPIDVYFPKGKYFLELYGASGAGLHPGKGGYSCGILTIMEPKIFYLYIGEQGYYNQNNDQMVTCIEGGWNGGGKACSYGYQCSGGGGTDIRLSINDKYEDRILIAGGGGGDGNGGNVEKTDKYQGGDGGGLIGGSSYGASGAYDFAYGDLYSYGGNQENGGECRIYSNTGCQNYQGTVGVGGACCGGLHNCGAGGGGYFGGGGGYDVTGGGGGSSYFNSTYITDGKLYKSDHIGDGIIFITPITFYNTVIHLWYYNPVVTILYIVVIN